MTIFIITIVVIIIIVVAGDVIFLFEFYNIVNINYDHLIIKKRIRYYNNE